tara:strand:+ start:144 stop:776 length:633 start_codon:yes stop_codon:yes gene_type:complete
MKSKNSPEDKFKDVSNLGALNPPEVPQFDPHQILKDVEQRAIDQGFDLEDPGYIEYYNELKRFLDSRSLNTYGDCEVTILWGKTMQDDYVGISPEEGQLDMFQSTMVFVKPDQILTDVLEQCRVNCKSKIGILVTGNVKDIKKDEIEEKEIQDWETRFGSYFKADDKLKKYVILSGVKPRSKYVQILVDEEVPDPAGSPFSQDHLQHLIK